MNLVSGSENDGVGDRSQCLPPISAWRLPRSEDKSGTDLLLCKRCHPGTRTVAAGVELSVVVVVMVIVVVAGSVGRGDICE